MDEFEPKLSRWQHLTRVAMVASAGVTALAQWVSSTLLGALVAAVLMLLAVWLRGGEIWEFSEVLNWTLSLDSSVIVAILGFLVAYAVAVSTWRQQKRIELQLSSTAEIAAFFQKVSAEILQLEIFAGRLEELHAKVAEGSTADQLEFDANYLQAQVPRVGSIRANLSQSTVDVHALRTRHEMTVLSGLIASKAFDRAVAAMDAIAEKMWFGVPLFAENSEQFLRVLALQDSRDYSNFIDVVRARRAQIDGASGALIGLVHGKLLPIGLGSVLRLWTSSRYLVDKR